MKTPRLPKLKEVEKMTDGQILKWWDWLQEIMDFSHSIGNEIEKRDLEV